jgi:hypothetical protein
MNSTARTRDCEETVKNANRPKSLVAATFEKAIIYVFAEKVIH